MESKNFYKVRPRVCALPARLGQKACWQSPPTKQNTPCHLPLQLFKDSGLIDKVRGDGDASEGDAEGGGNTRVKPLLSCKSLLGFSWNLFPMGKAMQQHLIDDDNLHGRCTLSYTA